MKLKKINRGEITTQQIVIMIILITSFVVILFFLFRLNFQDQTQKEICHNSVVLKGKSSTLSGGKLDCSTNYLCISSGKECKLINPLETVKVSSKNETFKAIADEMANCWWQFGEGKIDYTGTIVGRSCAICSVVEINASFNEKLTSRDFYDYLKKTKKDNSQTYFSYLYNLGYPTTVNDNNILNTDEKYYIVTGRSDSVKVPFIGIDIKDPLIVPVYFVNSSNLKTATGCTDFNIAKQ